MKDPKDEEQNTTTSPIQASAPKAKAHIPKFDRWKKNKHIQETANNMKTLIREPEVSELLNEIIPDNTEFPLLKESLQDILKSKKIELRKSPFSELLLTLDKLEHGCGIILFVTRLRDGTFKLEQRPVTPDLLIYEVKGSSLKDVSDTVMAAFMGPGTTQIQRQKELECPLKIIEIFDTTKKGESLLSKLFSTLENEAYPAVIKYRHGDDRANTYKLLVHMPPALNASQLLNAYDTMLTGIRNDFYKEVKKGRLPSRMETERKIQRAISELGARGEYIGGMSIDQIKVEVADILEMNADYLINEYRSVMRAERNTYRTIFKIIKEKTRATLAKMPEDVLCLLFAKKIAKTPKEFKSTYLPYVRELLKPKAPENKQLIRLTPSFIIARFPFYRNNSRRFKIPSGGT